MRLAKCVITVTAAAIVMLSAELHADKATYSFSSGAFSTGIASGQTISVKSALLSPSGAALTFTCPITAYGVSTNEINWSCGGGSVVVVTANKSLTFQGVFVSGTMTQTASGGGKGSRSIDSYQFNGEFIGTITVNGVTQTANGSVSQLVQTSTPIGTGSAPVTSGSFGWNSTYSPILIGDNTRGRIVASDSLNGANLAAYGSQGIGTGQFTTIAGITEDATGRIYVTDSGASRLVRIDDLTGKNWTELGSYGTGINHFNSPAGVVVDAAGKIWVVDSGNDRIVRFDDMNGTNWTSFGSLGSGQNQFQAPRGIALDLPGHIYVADTGNNRVLRFDDIAGKNWVSLAEVVSGSYGYLLKSPTSVAVNSSGQLYVALGGTAGYLIETTMPGGATSTVTNWSNPLSSISLDKAGTIYVSGQFSPGLAKVNDAASTGYYGSALGNAAPQPGPVYARPSMTPTPAVPVLSVSGVNFGNHNVGEPSAPYPVTLTNLGATVLTLDSVSTSTDFPFTNNCPSLIGGGASCSINLQFNPKLPGLRPADLVVSSNGVHPVLEAVLTGVGTAPSVVVLPETLSFISQTSGTSSPASAVTLTNAGTGPLTISSLTASGPYTQTNNCGKSIAAGAGCTINVVFQPTSAGALAGALTIADDAIPAGTDQTVYLNGTGTLATPAMALSPESLLFPDQKVGTTSAIERVTISNLSSAALIFGVPTYPPGFTSSSTCGASLARAASCVISAAFVPTVAGSVSSAILIPITGYPILRIGLSGMATSAGKAPVLKFSPATIDFGSGTIGEDTSKTLTVTNTSGLPTGIQSSALTGASSFAVTHNTCPCVLAGGASCAVSVTFVPNNPGSFSGTFLIVESTGAQDQATVSGTATSASN
jgi:hypothetical protein